MCGLCDFRPVRISREVLALTARRRDSGAVRVGVNALVAHVEGDFDSGEFDDVVIT